MLEITKLRVYDQFFCAVYFLDNCFCFGFFFKRAKIIKRQFSFQNIKDIEPFKHVIKSKYAGYLHK